jgi:dephospho-CoA kinase
VPGFVLVGIQAPPRLRFERSRLRARGGDPETFDAFLARERQENSSDPAGQQLAATFALADHVIPNDGDLEALRSRVEELLASLGRGGA